MTKGSFLEAVRAAQENSYLDAARGFLTVAWATEPPESDVRAMAEAMRRADERRFELASLARLNPMPCTPAIKPEVCS